MTVNRINYVYCQVLLRLSSKEACLSVLEVRHHLLQYKQNQQKLILEPCREQLRQLLKQIKEGGCMTQKSGSPLNPKDQLLYVPRTKVNQISGLSIIIATDTFFFFKQTKE